jgi:Icc-related predicted phosphoesterase
MRIYAVADIHGKNKRIIEIKDIISLKKPDILVIAGDITNYISPQKTFELLKDISIPIFCIRGNSDFKCVEKLSLEQNNMSLLGHTPVIYQNTQFLGLNGTIPLPFLSKIYLREAKRFGLIKHVITPETILVVHPPPRGICDKVGNKFSAGNFQLKALLKKHSPLMVLCGHIHEQAGYQFFMNTLVVNCAMNNKSSGAIIDYDSAMPLNINMITD